MASNLNPNSIRRIRIWDLPVFDVLLALAAGLVLPRLDYRFLDANLAGSMLFNPSSVVTFLGAVSSGMITLTGLVFSMVFVLIQFGSNAYTPRLTRWFIEDRVVIHSMGVFTSTFIFGLVALISVHSDTPQTTLLVICSFAMVLLLASVFFFIALVQRLSQLQISNVLNRIGDFGRQEISEMYVQFPEGQTDVPHPWTLKEVRSLPVSQTVTYHGGPKTVNLLDISRLVRLASQAGAVLEINYAVGDTVVENAPLIFVRQARAAISERRLLRALTLGYERTIDQDPKYAIRLLVDVAIKALSPAINDPTTAVQALDQIGDLLHRLACQDLETGYACDARGDLRLIYPTPVWEDYLALAVDEIRFYGAHSLQVMRRLNALLEDLVQGVPEDHQEAVNVSVQRLKSAIHKSFPDETDRNEALQTDRQGMGLSRSSNY